MNPPTAAIAGYPHVTSKAPELLPIARDVRDAREWNRFAFANDGASFCHQAEWRQIMADVLGHESHYLSVRYSDGALAGVLPLVHIRSRLMGNYLMSMPFLNYGGAIGDAQARTSLCEEAKSLAGRLNVDLLELRTRVNAPNELTCASRKVITVLPLPDNADELWEKGFKSKLRSQIRRAMKEDMDVRFGAAECGAFYEVFARNMRDLGTPVLPRAWFEQIAKTFDDQAIFGVVYFRGQPVAGACGFLWRDEFEITWASSLREHAARSPNMLLYWSLMQECIRRGARAFNFGRSTPGASTHRFKQQWGGADYPLVWGVWGDKTATPSPESTKYNLARNVWSRLPVPVANWVGPTLARQIP